MRLCQLNLIPIEIFRYQKDSKSLFQNLWNSLDDGVDSDDDDKIGLVCVVVVVVIVVEWNFNFSLIIQLFIGLIQLFILFVRECSQISLLTLNEFKRIN